MRQVWRSKHPRFNSMAFPKRSSLFHLFKYRTLKLINYGDLERLKSQWLTVKEGCERDQVSDNNHNDL